MTSPHTRTLRIALGLATLVVVGALVAATVAPATHLGPTTRPARTERSSHRRSPSFQAVPIAVAGSDGSGTPTALACAGSTCVLDTSATTGASTLWSSTNAGLTFATRIALPGAASASEVACQATTTCYAIARPASQASSGRLLELTEPESAISTITVAPGYTPSTIGCLPSGPCWTTGTRGGSTAGYVRQSPTAGWIPLPLPSLGPQAGDAITCATAGLCVDLTTVRGQMANLLGAVVGSLTQGFARALVSPNVDNLEMAACSLSSCWFAQDPLTEGNAIPLELLTSAGDQTVRLAVPSSSDLTQLACSARDCVALVAEQAKTDIHFYLLGPHPRALAAPKGLPLDGPSLLCDLGGTECLASLTTGLPAEGAIVHVAPVNGEIALGAPVTLGQSARLDPFPNLLTSCLPSECFEVEEGSEVDLLSLAPLSRAPARITAVRDPAAGDALLAPIALSCPTASSCNLLARLGDNGRDVLLKIDPGTGTVRAAPLPRGASAEDLACTSAESCVIAVSGISHHHGFPVLVTHNGGLHFYAGRVTNAVNDLSVLAVACPERTRCVAIAQHDFAVGDGTLRPAIATSANGGRTWRLVPLVGRPPAAMLDPATTGLSCVGSRCVGMLSANNVGALDGSTTLVFVGSPSRNSFAVHRIPLGSPRISVPINDALACTSDVCLATVTFSEPPAPSATYAVTITPAGIARSIRLMSPPAPSGLATTAHALLGTTSTQAEWLVPKVH